MAESSIFDSRQPADSMVGGERTRAYRYGMTLLCVGALFNWLGISDSEHGSDPVRFIGYTCLASGALLVCIAVCFWANAAHNHINNQIGPEENDDVIVNVVESYQIRPTPREKPPEYDAVADRPPSYDDAIKLSPAYLEAAGQSSSGISQESSKPANSNDSNKTQESSPLSRVIRMSTRLLRRTLSNVDQRAVDVESGQQSSIHRSSSAQDVKITQ